MNVNYLRNNEEDERMERKKSLHQKFKARQCLCLNIKFSPEFPGRQVKKETGWVSLLLSDKKKKKLISFSVEKNPEKPGL